MHYQLKTTAMQITSKFVLYVLHIIAWIIFAGLAVQAGIIIVNAILLFIVNPENHGKLWSEINFQPLFNYSTSHFIPHVIAISIVAIAKALIFYLILKISNDKKLSLSQPFSEATRRVIVLVAYLSLLIGLFAAGASNHSEWLTANGVQMPSTGVQHIDGADVWIFMSVILYVLSQVFKRGIEMQTENELTV